MLEHGWNVNEMESKQTQNTSNNIFPSSMMCDVRCVLLWFAYVSNIIEWNDRAHTNKEAQRNSTKTMKSGKNNP